jgi:hypothetical protein
MQRLAIAFPRTVKLIINTSQEFPNHIVPFSHFAENNGSRLKHFPRTVQDCVLRALDIYF